MPSFLFSALKNKLSPIWEPFLLHIVCYYFRTVQTSALCLRTGTSDYGVNKNSRVLLL